MDINFKCVDTPPIKNGNYIVFAPDTDNNQGGLVYSIYKDGEWFNKAGENITGFVRAWIPYYDIFRALPLSTLRWVAATRKTIN
jgi:hypothetical protein